MRRSCHKPKPTGRPSERTNHCYYWGSVVCRQPRTRARFDLQFNADPCLGARKRRPEPAGALPDC
jgi:hypothetical protein